MHTNVASDSGGEGAEDGIHDDAESLEYFILGSNVRKGVGAIASLKIPGVKQDRFTLASEAIFNRLTVDADPRNTH